MNALCTGSHTHSLTVYLNGQEEAAERILISLHKDSADPSDIKTHHEFALMKVQIDLEAEETNQGVVKIWRDPHLRKRFIVWLARCVLHTGQWCYCDTE